MVQATPGDTARSFASPFECPQGLAFDGQHIWVADRKSDMLYQTDAVSGSLVDSIPAPGYVPRGLAWDGSRIWCVDAEEELVFAINPSTRIIEKSIHCPVSRPMGLAWDGQYLWLAADRHEKLLQISAEDGTTISSVPAPTRNACGLTYDGTYLWVTDRYKDMIYMVTPEHGQVVVCFEAPGPHAWGLAWDGTHLWNVDYQSDRVYRVVVDDGVRFARTDEKVQHVEFIHEVRNYGPGPLRTLDVYLALPQSLDNQDLTGRVTFDPEPLAVISDQWGQEVAHFRFADIPATQFSAVTMNVGAKLYETRYFIFPNKVGKLQDIPEPILKAYLKDDTKFALNDPAIQEAVREAVGDERNPYWIGRKIYDHVIDHMEYELAGGWNIAPAVLARGNGSCSEYSFVYIAMCRAAGLPARYAGSIAIRGDDASYDDVFHRWVEIYLPGYGWIPVDPSRGDKKWPAERADSFGFLSNRLLITTVGGGGSEYLEWGYNANERWTASGRCKVMVENFAEWTPAETNED
jgi:transglutaminase-like putative cysteine protease